MIQRTPLILILLLLLSLSSGCSILAYHTLAHSMAGLSSAWLLLCSYGLIGFGLAIPAVGFALIFGWLQLLLLWRGHITPHLSEQGFLQAVNTLIQQLWVEKTR
jgi:hypothetical protein